LLKIGEGTRAPKLPNDWVDFSAGLLFLDTTLTYSCDGPQRSNRPCSADPCERAAGLNGRSVPGVRRAGVDLAAGRAHAECGGPAAVAAAIRGVGYEPLEHAVELRIRSMTCASCVGRRERALEAEPGALDAQVNLADREGHGAGAEWDCHPRTPGRGDRDPDPARPLVRGSRQWGARARRSSVCCICRPKPPGCSAVGDVEMPIEAVRPGDLVIIRPGERV